MQNPNENTKNQISAKTLYRKPGETFAAPEACLARYSITFSARDRGVTDEFLDTTVFDILAKSIDDAKGMAREKLTKTHEIREFVSYKVEPTDAATEAPTIKARWFEKPAEWIEDHTETLQTDVTDLVLAGDYYLERKLETIQLLVALRNKIGARHQDPEYICQGSVAVPTNAIGLSALRKLASFASDKVAAADGLSDIVDAESNLGRLLQGIDIAVSAGSCIIQGSRNATGRDKSSGHNGFKVALRLDVRAMAKLPDGEKLPANFLMGAIVGQELSGDEIQEIIDNENLCGDGVKEFLDRFMIPYEGGSYECDSCGQHDDDCDEINCIDSFTITEAMAEALESAGATDAVREALNGSADGAEQWSELLEQTDAEILVSLSPDKKAVESGIKFDPNEWNFAPEFESVEGLEELEWSEQARLLPLLTFLVAKFLQAGILPPIPGTLTPTFRSVDADQSTFSWDPATGMIRHGPIPLDSRSAYVWKKATAKTTHIGVKIDRQEYSAPIGEISTVYVPANYAGDLAQMLASFALSNSNV